MNEYIDHVQDSERHNDTVLKVAYAKDLFCPPEWLDIAGKKVLPYLWNKGNEDLTSILPLYLQPDNLMVYIGYEGTRTAGHTDICSSYGHNIMVNATDNAYAKWHVMNPKDIKEVSAYWDKKAGKPNALSHEKYFMKEKDLASAPFSVQIIEQRKGDFVIVPPDAPHQVWNYGDLTIKIAWNRITTETVRHAIDSTLGLYRSMSRPEVYRTKAVVYFYVQRLRDLLISDDKAFVDIGATQVMMNVYKRIVQSEVLPKDILVLDNSDIDNDKYFHSRVCDQCKCDIFNSSFSCGLCKSPSLDLCMDCYADKEQECPHVLSPCQDIDPSDLVLLHNECCDLLKSKGLALRPIKVE